jgi:hypothetical protein
MIDAIPLIEQKEREMTGSSVVEWFVRGAGLSGKPFGSRGTLG